MERRQYNRVLFSSSATLVQEDVRVETRLIDLSLKGALLELQEENTVDNNKPLQLEIKLSDREHVISMCGSISHQEGPKLGFFCKDIDIDSITELRRLIELNLADENLLLRDLKSLSASD